MFLCGKSRYCPLDECGSVWKIRKWLEGTRGSRKESCKGDSQVLTRQNWVFAFTKWQDRGNSCWMRHQIGIAKIFFFCQNSCGTLWNFYALSMQLGFEKVKARKSAAVLCLVPLFQASAQTDYTTSQLSRCKDEQLKPLIWRSRHEEMPWAAFIRRWRWYQLPKWIG